MFKVLTLTSAAVGSLAISLVYLSNIQQYVSSSLSSDIKESGSSVSLKTQSYSIATVSTDPLLIYIFNFLSESETDGILKSTENLFVPSRVYSPSSSSHRNSSSCILPDADPVHEIVIGRSKSFLDNVLKEYPATGLSYFDVEPLQLVSYGPSEYYHAHVDWFGALHRDKKGWNPRLYNRGASFFIYLQDDCIGGETSFPEILPSSNETQPAALGPLMTVSANGTSFRPKKGNGVFWVNLKPDGLGDTRLVHAGLPLKHGNKVGMNIWVKRDFGH